MRSDPDKPAPRDNLDFDFGEPDSDEGVDGALRNQLLWAFPHEQDTDWMLDQLTPTIRRVRQQRRARRLMATATVGLGIVAILGLWPTQRSLTDNRVVAGPTDAASSESATGAETGIDGNGLDNTPTTVSAPPAPAASNDFRIGTPRLLEPTSTVPPSSSPNTASSGPTTSSPDASTTSTTGQDGPTTTKTAGGGPSTTTYSSIPSSLTISSGCGSITVHTQDPDVELSDVVADPSDVIEIRKSGPEKVDVHIYKDDGDYCIMKAEIREGGLWTSTHDKSLVAQ